jgi:DNA modification methylase
MGDLWILGRHRLLCGDSTSIDATERLMGGAKADLIVTDPPYNVAYEGKTTDALTIQNDKMGTSDFYQFLLDAYTNYFTIAKDGASIYVFHADTEGVNFRKALVDSGFKLSQCCVWVKQTMVIGRQDYHWQHEPILYGWKPSGSHNWYSDRSQTTIWQFDRPMRSTEHPTMKPIALVEYPILNSSKAGDIVADLFGGSGSTLIACEKNARACRTMELDSRYCDVIVKRWQDFTGKEAVLDGRTFNEIAAERQPAAAA